MNYGLYTGFTIRNSSQAEAGYPQLRVLYVPVSSSGGDLVLTAANVDTLLLVDSPSPRTLPLDVVSVREGAEIHVAQWGASQVTISEIGGTLLRAPSTKKTRAQFSVITLTKISNLTNEWLLTGDFALS